MKLIQKYLTKSGCYRAGRKIAVKGLMIHSVGCPQPKASAFINNWDKVDAGACVHAIVEPGGDVYQLLPWDFRGWHCGGDANGTHIGVEMTEPATIRYTGGADWTETGDGRNITTGKKMLWHDRSEWVVVDGQHEPLVSEELFALANERAKPKKRDRSGVDMSGFKREVLFVCGYCGRSMVKKNHKYCCRYRTCGSDTECRRAVEDMETLEGSVMEYVRKTAEVMLGNSGRKDVETERETLEKKLDALRKEKERLSAEKMFLYDKYRSGGMTREQFKARTGSMGVRVEEIGKEIGEAEDGIERLKGCGSRDGETVLEGIAALREFDKGVLRKGIERIRVFGEGRIEVVWKGGDMFGGGDL